MDKLELDTIREGFFSGNDSWTSLFDAIPYAAMIIRKDRILLAVNKAGREIGIEEGRYCWDSFGQKASIPQEHKEYFELYGEPPGAGTHCIFCHADEALESQEEIIADVEVGGKVYKTYWIALSDNEYLHYAIDVTQKKKPEAYLTSNPQWLNRAEELAHLGSWMYDHVSDKLWWSDETYRIFGLKPQEKEMTFASFLKMVHPDFVDEIMLKTFLALETDDTPYREEYKIILPSGEEKLVYEEADLQRNRDGVAVGMIGTILDLSKHKRFEKSQSADEKDIPKLEKRLSPLPLTIFMIVSLFSTEILSMFLISLLPEMRRDMEAIFDATILVVLITPLFYFVFYKKLVRQIHKLTSAKEELVKSERMFKLLSDSSTDVVIITNGDGNILSWNKAGEKLFGYRKSEIIGKPVSTIVPHRFKEMHEQGIKRVGSGGESNVIGKTVELEGLKKDGSIFPLELSLSSWKSEGELFFSGIIRDITARKKILLELENANRALWTTFACNEVLVHSTSEKELLHDICKVIFETKGYKMAWIGMARNDDEKSVEPVAYSENAGGYLKSMTIRWDDSPEGMGVTGRAIKSGKLRTSQIVNLDATMAPWAKQLADIGIASSIAIPLIEDGVVYGSLNIYAAEEDAFSQAEVKLLQELAENISFGLKSLRNEEERKKNERSLLKLNNAVEQAVEVIVITDPKGNIEYVNPVVEKVTGYSPCELIGQSTKLFKSDKQDEAFYKKLWDTINGGRIWKGNVVNRKKNGDKYYEEMTISPIISDEGEITNFIAIKRDVSKEKELKMQLIHAEKLSTIGTFVSGVAHELNNPLTAVLGFSTRLLKKGNPPEYMVEDLKIIAEQSKRTVDIVQNLLKFSRQQKGGKEMISVNKCVEETLKLQGYRFKSDNMEVNTNLTEHSSNIIGNFNQVQQVLMNVVHNAYQAMLEYDGKRVLVVTTKVADGEVLISFKNSGNLIPEESLPKLFDPFYTTKDVGKGTGLGLYISYQIVEEHGGAISAHNICNSEVEFRISFPARDEKRKEKRAVSALGKKDKGKKALIVDDEPPIRQWLAGLLEEKGFYVRMADNGKTATEILHKGSFDVILCDIKMPVMDGFEFVKWMKEYSPEHLTKTVIVTGSIDDNVDKLAQEVNCQTILKPFEGKKLYEILAKIFENSNGE